MQPLLQEVGAKPLLSLSPEVPVLSEEHWDHCILTHFPSLDAVTTLYGSADWQQSLAARRAALENSVTVVTHGIPLPG